MQSLFCKQCDKTPDYCRCNGFKKSVEQKEVGFACEFYESGRKCTRLSEYLLPRPGVRPKGAPSDHPAEWRRLCKFHYEYDRPDQWYDDMQAHHKAKLEEKYGKFLAHKSVDLVTHCLRIMYEIGGAGAKVADMLARAAKKAKQDSKKMAERYKGYPEIQN